MQLVVIREGRVGLHVGDVVDVPDGDDTTTFDLTFFSHIESDASQEAMKLKDDNTLKVNPNPGVPAEDEDRPNAHTENEKEGAE